MIAVVFRCPHGFVTDFGEEYRLVAEDGSGTTLPRFGVWRFDYGRGKWQVAHTTNDQAEAITLASSSPEAERFTHCTGCEIRCWSIPGSRCACGGTRHVPEPGI